MSNQSNGIKTPLPQLFEFSDPRAVKKVAEARTEERLPFTVRLVRNEVELIKAVQIRYSAYARHMREFASTLRTQEHTDTEPGVVVMLAESKLDGSPLGTMRIQTNEYMPLALEHSVELPEWMRSRPLAEATRLGVTQEATGRLVKTALFKFYFLYCQQIGIEWLVIAGRSPIDRQYERLMFQDVDPSLGFIPLQHASNIPHRIMSFEIATAEARWRTARHPLYDFVFRTLHPDLILDLRPSLAAPHNLRVQVPLNP